MKRKVKLYLKDFIENEKHLVCNVIDESGKSREFIFKIIKLENIERWFLKIDTFSANILSQEFLYKVTLILRKLNRKRKKHVR